MTREDFINLIGQDVVVDYPFFDKIHMRVRLLMDKMEVLLYD